MGPDRLAGPGQPVLVVLGGMMAYLIGADLQGPGQLRRERSLGLQVERVVRSRMIGRYLRCEESESRRDLQAAEDPFDPCSYEALLRIDVKRAEAAFPQVFAPDAPDALADDWDEEED